MERRNYGIDLLRMLAMWMVIILHILNKGGVLSAAAPLSAGYEAAKLLEAGAYCAVNCYGLISGYVGVQHRFRYSGSLFIRLALRRYLPLFCPAVSMGTGCSAHFSRCCSGNIGM